MGCVPVFFEHVVNLLNGTTVTVPVVPVQSMVDVQVAQRCDEDEEGDDDDDCCSSSSSRSSTRSRESRRRCFRDDGSSPATPGKPRRRAAFLLPLPAAHRDRSSRVAASILAVTAADTCCLRASSCAAVSCASVCSARSIASECATTSSCSTACCVAMLG